MKNLITLDFETYYDSEYSLSKMTTEAYLRDKRYQTIGVSLALNDKKPIWIPGPEERIKEKLVQLPWSDLGVVAHNALFDCAILNWKFGIKPKRIFDTLSMARAVLPHGQSLSLANLVKHYVIGEKGTEVINARGKRLLDFTRQELARYAAYCRLDVSLTQKLFKKLLGEGIPLDELKLIDLTIRMFTDPVLRLDSALLEQHLSEVRENKRKLLIGLATELGHKELAVRIALNEDKALDELKKELASNNKFAELLKKHGVEVPKKISATTGKETFAFAKTDEGFQALAEHPKEVVQALHAARIGVKSTLEETRTERLIGISQRGLFPIPLKYFGAHTSRWSGMDKINAQNFSSRGAGAGKLKRAILPPEGYVWIDCDSSQIEARVLAWLAGQEDLVQAFFEKRDVYSETATSIYGREINRKRIEVDEEGNEYLPDATEGFVGKTAVLSGGYGAGAKSFQSMLRVLGNLDMPIDEAQAVITAYRNRYPRIPLLWKEFDRAIPLMHQGKQLELGRNGIITVNGTTVTMPNGVKLHYPRLHKEPGNNGYDQWVFMQGRKPTTIYGGKFVENAVQCLARAIVAYQMLLIAKRYRVVLTVHDSVGSVVRAEEAKQAQVYIEECMRTIPDWAEGLPIDCESSVGASYGDC